MVTKSIYIVSYFSIKMYAMGTHQMQLGKAFLMSTSTSTHNVFMEI